MSEEEDELQEFIADCEWKTRKILRQSNKRMKDSARLLEAKERVESLKRKGGKKDTAKPPEMRSLPKTNTTLAHDKGTPTTEWHDQDKIIHDACETIRTMTVDSKPTKSYHTNPRKEIKAANNLHSSLYSGPFNDKKKGKKERNTAPKSEPTRKSKKGFSSANPQENKEPALLTRRTIERDFYIMSKKRNKPRPMRRNRSAKSEGAEQELNSSVLRNKYRYEDRVMEANDRRSERLCEEFERLKSYDGNSDESAGETENNDDSSTSSEEEAECSHAIYELVKRHITNENLRSQGRSNKMLSEMKFKPDVQAMWDELQQGNAIGEVTRAIESPETGSHSGYAKKNCQVQSVPLHLAMKNCLQPKDIATPEREQPKLDNLDDRNVLKYVNPYNEPPTKLFLINNEKLAFGRATHLTISITYELVTESGDSTGNDGSWIFEIYDPCDGSLMRFTLNDCNFNLLQSNFISRLGEHPAPATPSIKQKIVHIQEVMQNGSRYLYAVVALLDGLKISAVVHRTLLIESIREIDLNALTKYFHPILTLKVCEIIHLLEKHCFYSVLDDEFWMNGTNGPTIWTPLVDLISTDKGVYTNHIAAARSSQAYEALIALKVALQQKDSKDDILRMFCDGNNSLIKCDATRSTKDGHVRSDKHYPPLSMRISSHSPYLQTICPGHSVIGKRGIWRLMQPIVEEKAESSISVWLCGEDVKLPTYLDTTQATAFFYHKNLGHQKGVSVTALSRLAFESPVLAPYCYGVTKGYSVPPVSKPELVNGIAPQIKLPCTSLLENPVKSRFDTLLPPTVMVLDPGASDPDWKTDNLRHIRNVDIFDKDGFRVKTYARKIEYDNSVKTVSFGISEKAALPNRPDTTPFATHTSVECCDQLLSRKRTASDYHYIAESDGEGTSNVPYVFLTHMKGYSAVFMSRKSINAYREEEQFLRATKEAGIKKASLALKMKAAEELVEARLKERLEKIERTLDPISKLSKNESSVAVNLPTSVYGSLEHKITCDTASCDVELQLPLAETSIADDQDELEQIANMLLDNTNFVRAIARRLSIPEDRISQIEKKSSAPTRTVSIPMQGKLVQNHTSSQSESRTGNDCQEKDETMTRKAVTLPQLKINCKKFVEDTHVGTRGDGWKRLPRVETLVGEFNLETRKVQKGGGPNLGFVGRRNFISPVNAPEAIPYIMDPELFTVKTKSMFIPDLTAERLRVANSIRRHKMYEKSLLSMDQQVSLQEILQIEVSNAPQRQVDETNAISDVDADKVVATNNDVSADARAIIAVKNHNLSHLEQLLDTEGLSVGTRDLHGNTLFILSCQQGNKKMAKFLLRRGADINAQNNGGNTALHYLYEYHHNSLAEYLHRKGANDSLRNADGLTVYEGVHPASDGEY